MNRIFISGLAILLGGAVSFLDISYAGDFQSFGGELTITGSVNQENQFVDENGRVYGLAVCSKAFDTSVSPGQVVEIKDALLERDGQKTVSITDYKIVNE